MNKKRKLRRASSKPIKEITIKNEDSQRISIEPSFLKLSTRPVWKRFPHVIESGVRKDHQEHDRVRLLDDIIKMRKH